MNSRLLPLVPLLFWFGACHAGGPALSPSVGMDDAEGSSSASDPAPPELNPELVSAVPLLSSHTEAPTQAAPDVDSLPWQEGVDVGYGIAFKDTDNPRGTNVFIGCAGYSVTLDAATTWVGHLYTDSLRDRGVRYIYAVQGPSDVLYTQQEIGNTRIAQSLTSHVGSSTNFVLVVAHSSGAYVAHELLNELATGFDPNGVTRDKIVYFDLDGGDLGLSQTAFDRMRRAYFVAAFDPVTKSYSPNQDSMVSGGTTFSQKGGYFEEAVPSAGCSAGASWCLHMSLITSQPHDPATADANTDYTDFQGGREVVHKYIDDKADDAGLAP
jgi:hypothetical protein